MATTENNGLLKYKDANGNLYLLYPITKAELVDGLDDALAAKANKKVPAAVGNLALLDANGNLADGGVKLPLPISAGGTGATTAGAARAALGATPLTNNAGGHNSVYRGKNLGSTVTNAQWAVIAAGTFDDLYIGDYWVIGGVNYRIAAFDYYYNCGDTNTTKHHAVIIPDTVLYNAQMNTSDVTTGGYVGSAMYKSNLAQAKTTITNAFGSHLLTKRELLVNAVSGNIPISWAWFDSQIDLMDEVQAYGAALWGAHDGNGYNSSTGVGQFPLFSFDQAKLRTRQSYWLRDVSTSECFSFFSAIGNVNNAGASYSLGVRPYFCIC